VKADADLFRRPDLVVEAVAAFEQLRMIENGRTAGHCQFRKSDQHAGAGGFLGGSSPDPVLRFRSGEEVVILRGR
jgi:hypothetical protein